MNVKQSIELDEEESIILKQLLFQEINKHCKDDTLASAVSESCKVIQRHVEDIATGAYRMGMIQS